MILCFFYVAILLYLCSALSDFLFDRILKTFNWMLMFCEIFFFVCFLCFIILLLLSFYGLIIKVQLNFLKILIYWSIRTCGLNLFLDINPHYCGSNMTIFEYFIVIFQFLMDRLEFNLFWVWQSEFQIFM